MSEETKTKDQDRKVMVVEPDDERRDTMVNLLKQLLVGAMITDIEDVDDARDLLDEDSYDTVVLDFQNPDFSNSDFVKCCINDTSLTLVAFTLENLDSGDEKGEYKLEPLRKLFELGAFTK